MFIGNRKYLLPAVSVWTGWANSTVVRVCVCVGGGGGRIICMLRYDTIRYENFICTRYFCQSIKIPHYHTTLPHLPIYLSTYDKNNKNVSNKNCFSWRPCLEFYLNLIYYLKLWKLNLDLKSVNKDACPRSIGLYNWAQLHEKLPLR